MRKTIGSLLLLLIAYNTTQAQFIQIGPRIGLSTSHITFDQDLKKQYDPEVGFGYQLGAIARISLPIIYIQPELLFTDSRAKYHSYEQQVHTLNYKKIDVPIMVGMKFMELIRLQLGPIFSFLITAKDNQTDVISSYEKLSAGYQVGLGIDIYNFLIDLKYEGSLSKFGNKLGGISAEHRGNLLILSVGFNMF